MDEREYYCRLGEIRGSRLNVIIRAVNNKLSLEEPGAAGDVEKMFYERLVIEAQQHEAKCGFWPVFDMWEIDYDDPILDIYHGSADEWSEERKKNGKVEKGQE